MSATWQWAKANPDAAARRIRELERENAALREALSIEQERSFYWRVIAGRKEAQPIRVDHSGDINEMMQARKEAQP